VASISKEKNGWRVQVAIQGIRESRMFSTKAEATTWAAQRETEIRTEKATGVQRGRTVDDAFRRYEKEVSAHKRGHDKEVIRLNAIGRMAVDDTPLKDWKLADVTPEVLGRWRDHRLNVDKVLGSSVNRDLNLLSHVFRSEGMEMAGQIADHRCAPASRSTATRPPIQPGRDRPPVRGAWH